MSPKKSKAIKSKDLGLKGKGKGHKGKKKRKHGRKSGVLSYTLLPKRKRLAEKVVTKLNLENDKYTIARGLDSIKRLELAKAIDVKFDAITLEEKRWRDGKKRGDEYQRWKKKRMDRIVHREEIRKQKAELKRDEELSRKKYRLHPQDKGHEYLEGYKKTRHRVSKKRFMTCVDVELFQSVLKGNKELSESPLWNEKLSPKNLSVERAKQLKDHLYQFDVLVEALKFGLFDIPGSDSFPLHRVRRKKKAETDSATAQRKESQLSDSGFKTKRLKRLLSFPPFENSNEEDMTNAYQTPGKVGLIKGAVSRVANWISTKKDNEQGSKGRVNEGTDEKKESTKGGTPNSPKVTVVKEGDIPSSVSSIDNFRQENSNEEKPRQTSNASFHWVHKTSPKSFPPLETSTGLINTGKDTEQFTPFADLLTIKIPRELGHQKKFIRTLVDKKSKKKPKKKSKPAAETRKQEEYYIRQRQERVERSDPLQRLHQDEKDSDIWTLPSSTTTDGYASWRRPRDLRNAGNTQEILAHKVDTSFGWRVALMLIIIWEIGGFVKQKLDDIYYWIFTSHLYRENIWLFEPTLFPSAEKYYIIHLQEWTHAVISIISLSIMHRENECVSLLFAFSLLFDGVVDIGVSTHDYSFLPEPISWSCVFLTALHVVWKVFIICLFIGYHYYCAGYIRKAREFKHRKTKLHNLEIKAKGTKGLQQRRMAWTWMTRHARDTNLRNLRKKYPDIRDGNFPEDKILNDIKFSEAKELRLYTQNHNLNIGYPYNKLRDMERYVFHDLEKSDYAEEDEKEESIENKKKSSRLARKSSRAVTVQKWQDYNNEQERIMAYRRKFSVSSIAADKGAPLKTARSHSLILPRASQIDLTLHPSYSSAEVNKQTRPHS